MTVQPYNNFRLEIFRLLKLYNASIRAYKEEATRTSTLIHFKENDFDPSANVFLDNIEEENYFISGNSYELKEKYRKSYQGKLREVLLVRLISTLEVYMVEMVRETFLQRKDLFTYDRKIEFSHGELLSSDSISILWSKLINNECRKLQNQGFHETKNFYLRVLNINFNDSKFEISHIELLHDKRHLLVHRLGKTDKQFRHKYSTEEKQITISPEDFYKAIEAISDLGSFILKEYEKLVGDEKNKTALKSTHVYSSFEIFPFNKDGESTIDNNFSFIVDDQLVRFKDLLKSLTYKGDVAKLDLYGRKEFINYYFRLLNKSQKHGNLKIESKYSSYSPNMWVTENDLKKARKIIPKKPLDKDFFKTLSEEQRISLEKAQEITRILKNEY